MLEEQDEPTFTEPSTPPAGDVSQQQEPESEDTGQSEAKSEPQPQHSWDKGLQALQQELGNERRRNDEIARRSEELSERHAATQAELRRLADLLERREQAKHPEPDEIEALVSAREVDPYEAARKLAGNQIRLKSDGKASHEAAMARAEAAMARAEAAENRARMVQAQQERAAFERTNPDLAPAYDDLLRQASQRFEEAARGITDQRAREVVWNMVSKDVIQTAKLGLQKTPAHMPPPSKEPRERGGMGAPAGRSAQRPAKPLVDDDDIPSFTSASASD